MAPDTMHLGKRRDGRRRRGGVSLAEADLATHVHVLGRSGMGKSWLLRQMLATDIKNNDRGRDAPGLCLIDPAGDLYDFALAKVSTCKRARRRLHLIDLSRRDYFPGVNYLDQPGNMDVGSQAATIIHGINKAFGQADEATKVEMERLLRIVLIPFRLEGFTFDEVARFIADPQFRNAVLHKLWQEGKVNEALIAQWAQINRLPPGDQENRTRSVLNRVVRFISLATGDAASNIFAQEHTTVDFKQAMDERRIVLCKLPRGAGFEAPLVDLLGTILVDKIMQAGYQREPNVEPYFRVYIDEFARFVSNRDIEEGLNEMRKQHVSFVLAHQFLAQLQRGDSTLYNAVKTNCNVRILFSSDDEDAEVAAKSMFTEFLAEDQVQDELETQMITPVEETRTTVSEAESESYMDSLTSASSGGAIESSGSVSQSSTGVAVTYGGDGQGNFFLMPDPMATAESSGSGTAYSSQQGTSRGWAEASSTAHGRTTTVGRTTVPFYNLVIGKQVTSRQWYGQPDKLAKLVHQIVSQKRQQAFIQVGRAAPIPFVTADVEEPRTTRAGMQLALNCAYEENQSGLRLEAIEQQRLQRSERIRGIIQEHGIEELPAALSTGGAVDAEFEVVDDDASPRRKARIQVPRAKVKKNPFE